MWPRLPAQPNPTRREHAMTRDNAVTPVDGDTAEKMPFDTSVAHQARMYDFVLGGKDNYAADRAAVEAGLKVWPDMAFAMRANRAFLGRVVRYLAGEAGIRQFLDIGTGIPTAGNTHQVAQAIAPESRVVYVDYDHCKSGCAHAPVLLTELGVLRSATLIGQHSCQHEPKQVGVVWSAVTRRGARPGLSRCRAAGTRGGMRVRRLGRARCTRTGLRSRSHTAPGDSPLL